MMYNPRILCCVVLSVTATCHFADAYNFRDVDFNELLSIDLERALTDTGATSDEAIYHPRQRRDEEAAVSEDKCKKRHRRNKLCCADDVIENMHEAEKNLFRNCYKEVTGMGKFEKPGHGFHKNFDLFSCEEVEKRRSEMTCVQQCIGQKKGLLSEDGSPRAEAIADYLRQAFTNETWFESVSNKVVSNCLAEAKNATENPIKYQTEGLKPCNPSGLTLRHCLFKEVQLSCPASQIKDQTACERFRERIQKELDVLTLPSPPAPDGLKDE